MGDIKVLGANIPRAGRKVIESLIDAGVLYVGEDNQLHVIDAKENISTPTAKKE
jgi:hypothetical protein